MSSSASCARKSNRCRLGKTLDRLEYDKQNLSLAALNTRLAEHDR